MTTSRLQIHFLGVNEGDDPKNLPPGTMLRALNVQMDKSRRLGKRRGTVGLVKSIVGGGSVATGVRLLTRGDDSGVTDGEKAYVYSGSLAAWRAIDRPTNVHATKRGFIDSTRSVAAVDCAISGDLLVSVYKTDTGAIFVQVDSVATGERLLPALLLASSSCSYPRVLINGTNALLFFSAGGTVEYQTLSLTSLSLTGGSGSLVTNSTATAGPIDVAIGTSATGNTLYLLYCKTGGGSAVTLASFDIDAAPSLITSSSYATASLYSCRLVYGASSSRILAIYADATNGAFVVTTTVNLVAVAGPTSVIGAAGVLSVFIAEASATHALVGWTRTAATADRFDTELVSIAAIAVTAASVRTTYGLRYASAPWTVVGRWFCQALANRHPAATGPAASSSVVCEIETVASITGAVDCPHVHVATLENQTGWQPGITGYVVRSATDANGWIRIPSIYRNREPLSAGSVIPIGWSLYRLATGDGDTGRPVSLAGAALCAAAAPYWYDRDSAYPYGFAHPPTIVSVTDTGVGAMAAGVYSYVATYAWRDANGVLHRSMPSPALTGTAGANRALTVVVATASLSGRQKAAAVGSCANPVLVELWRTVVTGVGPHYRVTLEPEYQVVLNDSHASTVSLVDTKADANIGGGSNTGALTAQQVLYTDLGELENVPPPSFITVATHRGRLVGIGPDLRTVWLSKDSTLDATLAPGFNEALTLAFAHDKTALASLDAVLVVFGMDRIDVVHGDGPDDKGDQNTWQIQSVQTDVGCTNPRSVVTAPMGVLFESRRGIELLDRGLGVTWIGKGIDDTLTDYPFVTSAVLVADLSEVRWTCDDGEGNGIVLVFDYLNKVWFTRTYNDASDTGNAGVPFVDAALIDGVYTLLTVGGQVYRESSATALDGATTYVETDVLLAPISAQPGRSGWSNDNLGWQRAKDLTLMGTSTAEHDLAISFAQDYANTFSQTETFAAGTTPTTPGPLEKARVTIATQKCQAIQIRIRDLTPTGNVAYGNSSYGPILESIALRVGTAGEVAKTSAGQQQ